MEFFEIRGMCESMTFRVPRFRYPFQIFQPTDTLTEEEALKTTQVLVETIYSHEENAMESNDDIQGLARDACDECLNILLEPEKSQAKPAIKILCAFMSTTRSSNLLTQCRC